MKKHTFIFIISAITLLSGCTSLRINKIYHNTNVTKPGVIFYLPKSKIHFNIVLNRSEHFDGQFSSLAKKLLPVRQKKTEPYWEIENIAFNVMAVPDTSECYLISNCKYIPNISLTDDNIIVGINTTKVITSDTIEYAINNYHKPIKPANYNDYFVKKFQKKVTDTIYKTIIRDSVTYTRQSYINKSIDKDNYDHALDIYRYLVKLRKHKFKLIAAMDDNISTGNLITRFHHLDSIENVLMELISGKTITQQYQYDFTVMPDTGYLTQIIGYFSKTIGLNDSKKGTPLILKINYPEEPTIHYTSNKKSRGLPYRIAKETTAELYLGNLMILKKNIIISQWGPTFELSKGISIKNSIIRYNAETGNIYSISRK